MKVRVQKLVEAGMIPALMSLSKTESKNTREQVCRYGFLICFPNLPDNLTESQCETRVAKLSYYLVEAVMIPTFKSLS